MIPKHKNTIGAGKTEFNVKTDPHDLVWIKQRSTHGGEETLFYFRVESKT